MSIVVIGGAGFIGSSLVKKLNQRDSEIVVIDKLSLGRSDYIDTSSVTLIDEDINNTETIIKLLRDYNPIEEIWHLAANSDIPEGISNIEVDLNDTFMTTVSVLKVIKEFNIKRLYFSSTSAIYGDIDKKLYEDIGPLFPISNYGAMKLASEAIISSAVESYLESAIIYRFPNVVGTPATHGVILDFVRGLKEDPSCLQVLGNGSQQKLYLHVNELIDAMFFINDKSSSGLSYFNIGPNDEGISVREIAEKTVERISPKAKIKYQDSNKGWPGDVPKFSYSVDKLKALGWSKECSSKDAITKAINEIATQEGF